MAEVTLVTDKDYAVPVRVERSGVRSVMYGAGTGRLPELRFLSPNAEIQAGDRLIDLRHRRHLPGRASPWRRSLSVERETGQIFARVICRPLAGVEKSPHLLILGRVARAAAAAGRGLRRPEPPRKGSQPDAANSRQPCRS